MREKNTNVTDRTAVVLDEAGAVNVGDMTRLLRLGSPVILSGDIGQHGLVKRGDAVRIIEDHSPYSNGQSGSSGQDSSDWIRERCAEPPRATKASVFSGQPANRKPGVPLFGPGS
ncbi:MAG: AAA family ATPase [Verrucomicrobiales bacterium]|nr:AAA family ATPase [Verrucomicrobiales bacterium]